MDEINRNSARRSYRNVCFRRKSKKCCWIISLGLRAPKNGLFDGLASLASCTVTSPAVSDFSTRIMIFRIGWLVVGEQPKWCMAGPWRGHQPPELGGQRAVSNSFCFAIAGNGLLRDLICQLCRGLRC